MDIGAFRAGLDPTSLLDEARIEELAAGLAAEARASAPSNQHEAESGRPVPHLKPHWRRRMVLTTLLSTLAVKIALASVAVAATTLGLASAGALPDPAQQVVSDVASRIGITVPAPSSEATTQTGSESGPDLPEQASDTARAVIDAIFGGGDDHPGPPADLPKGPPEDRPTGPPEDRPTGPPEDRPQGPPNDLPQGPPAP